VQTIALFGATGRVGTRVREYALEAGDVVRALVRDPGRVPTRHDGRLHVTQGDALDERAVDEVVRGADAIISALAAPSLEAPGDFLFQAMTRVVAAARARGVRRVLAVANSGVLDARAGELRMDAPGFLPLYRPMAEAHAGTWRALRESGLDWTLVCPPDLVPGERTERFRAEADRLPAGGRSISVEDTAAFLLEQIARPEYVRRRVGIAY
jgi:uncharacterized protein